MSVVLFVIAVILAVVGLSAIMNVAVKRVTYVSPKYSVRLIILASDDFEMPLRSAANRRRDDYIIACISEMTDREEEACRTLCDELGIICCDKSTLNMTIEKAINI